MYLYNFTLQKTASITHAVYGNFSAPKAQEIAISRGKILELLRPDENGKIVTVLSVEIFGIIRSLLPFRLTGSTKDFLVVGSDSGRINILEYNPTTNKFDKIHEETFGRSGCRRIVPGQYLAIDPKGRAVMISAIEKQKFVYILNRDSAANLTISSPLEAHKTHSIIFDCVGVDVSFDNPLFACIEIDYEDADQDPSGEAIKNTQKHLTYYELDLGLNHVVRQSSEPIPRTSNLLINVPGGNEGPGGVLVLCEDYIVHKTTDHEEKRSKIPRRRDIPRDSGVLITSWALVKQKDWFFFIVQSEYGDLYKVTINYDQEGVKEVKIRYFDTVPVANSLAVLKTGYMFVAAESGDHALYQFQAIGSEDDDDIFQIDGDSDHVYFRPRPLKNLLQIDKLLAAQPITDLMVANPFGEETQQIIAACGKGSRSTLRILRHGIAVTERAVSTLPGVPSAVWSIKTNITDPHDKYIIVSFLDATMVLSIGETVEEVHNSGFLSTAPTLHAALFGDDSLIQVHPDGIRHIRADARIQEWQPPNSKKITMAAVNNRQVVAVVGTDELIYFELDQSGQVVEVEKISIGKTIVAIGIAPIPAERQRARYLGVADVDNKMRIYKIGPEGLQALSMQLLPSKVSSIKMVEMVSLGGSSLYVNMGTVNGVLFRATIDKNTGQLSDNRARFLGSQPIKLFEVTINGSDGILALSSRSWLCYNYQGRYTMMPLSYVPLQYASGFHSEQCPEGIVSITGDSLRIFTTESLGDMFNQKTIPLRYTPRKMIIHPQTKYMIMLESDNDCYPANEKQQIVDALKKTDGETEEMKIDNDHEEGEEEDTMPESIYGVPRPGSGRWASCLRIMDIARSRTLDLLELDNNETAVSIATCAFQNKQGELFLCVGTAKDLVFEPRRSCSEGYVHIYRLQDRGAKFQLVHKTAVGGIPGALCGYGGRLLIGVNQILRIYDLGKRKLLRKCETKKLYNHIISIWTTEDKIIVGDIQESYFFVKYHRADNNLYVVADDVIPRWITSGTMLDPTTIAAGDKFGNLFIVRLPDKVNKQLEEDPTGGAIQWNTKDIAGAPYKLDLLCNFYSGETICKVVRTTITPGGGEIILYSTVFGSIGALLPFTSREDIDFFTELEMNMRLEFKPLCGRDHLSFRSYYAPVKSVIDGDLCEQFALLSPDKQRKIADELKLQPMEIQKKLEDFRNSI